MHPLACATFPCSKVENVTYMFVEKGIDFRRPVVHHHKQEFSVFIAIGSPCEPGDSTRMVCKRILLKLGMRHVASHLVGKSIDESFSFLVDRYKIPTRRK